jgi:CPA2 family monovalent cation:H+ antiporter-2
MESLPFESLKLKIVLILTIGFAFASILGYFAHRIKLSPILGYLLGGYIIGPFSPGFTVDLQISEQLAEIGVILMMFGVGLHFKWQDLVKYKHIAIPGALAQTSVATVAGILLIQSMGWSLESGLIYGLAIGVASTVVLARVLSDNHFLNTASGHISIGWLIVEDMVTVAALLLIPPLAGSINGDGFPLEEIIKSLGLTVIKFFLLALIMFTVGKKVVSYFLSKIALTNSHELFTLGTLAITFLIAAGSTLLLGTSIALGSFIAGMVIGQTVMQHKVSNNARPLKDAFIVIFFLSVGMLFNPKAISEHFLLFACTLIIILILKPLTAFCICKIYKYPIKTALVTALGLAQIGEFSFILTEEAMNLKLLPEAGYDIIVACALITIAINPLLFKLLKNNTKEIQQ